MERRLAAILAADVVGYSRLMEQDEAGTLAALTERRKGLLQPLVAQHRGRIVKVMGDGVLVEFASAVNAVRCAVELQKRMAAANDSIAQDRRVTLRIGINLGDVVVEGGDLYGDGVNIAARLQVMSEPGGICVSGKIREEVGRKLPLTFADMGEQTIKNMTTPVRVYRIAGEGGPGVTPGNDSVAAAKPSIAVLPFTNMSGDPEQQYFSDGITDDIITELSRFRSLFVIARSSSFQYRDQTTDVRRIARELAVQYVIEGSVRKAGNSVRITAQLIDAATGNHLWVERYDCPLNDIFAVQDEVVHKIAARLEGRLATRMAEQARHKPTQSMIAYDYVLRARQHLGTFDWAAAEPLLRCAINLDPDYAQAHAWLSVSIVNRFFDDPRAELLEQALDHAKRSVAFDETDGLCHCMLATAHTFRREFDAAGVHFKRALALNPADVLIIAHHCHWLLRIGRHEEALAGWDDVLLREPFPPNWYWEGRGVTLLAARRYQDATETFGRMSYLQAYDHAYLAACYAQLGRMEEAKIEVGETLRMWREFTIRLLMLAEPFKHPADAEPLLEGMRKVGLPE